MSDSKTNDVAFDKFTIPVYKNLFLDNRSFHNYPNCMLYAVGINERDGGV